MDEYEDYYGQAGLPPSFWQQQMQAPPQPEPSSGGFWQQQQMQVPQQDSNDGEWVSKFQGAGGKWGGFVDDVGDMGTSTIEARTGIPVGKMRKHMEAVGDWATGKEIDGSKYSDNFLGGVDKFTDMAPVARVAKHYLGIGSQADGNAGDRAQRALNTLAPGAGALMGAVSGNKTITNAANKTASWLKGAGQTIGRGAKKAFGWLGFSEGGEVPSLRDARRHKDWKRD